MKRYLKPYRSFMVVMLAVFTLLLGKDSLMAKENLWGRFELAEQVIFFYDMGYSDNSSLREDNHRDAEKFLDEDSSYIIEKNDSGNLTKGFGLESRFFYYSLGVGLIPISIYYYDDVKTKISDTHSTTTLVSEISIYQLLTINTYYRYMISESSFMLFGAGIGLCWANIGLDEDANLHTPDSVGQKYGDWLQATGLGYNLMAEYNYLLGNITMALGVGVRYTRIGDFSGEYGNDFDIEATLTGWHAYFAAGVMFW